MRFMMQYDHWHGDYTTERQEIFGTLTVDDLLEAIEGTNGEKPGR